MTAPQDLWLVVGLGNPGPSYSGHRHNIGYLVADELASRMGSAPAEAHKSGRAEVVEGRLAPPGSPGPRVVLMRGRGYMNESGGPVSTIAKFYGVAPEGIIAIHDELDIAFGTLRVKFGGGDNGHNGLRSMRGVARHRRLLPGPGRHRPPAGPPAGRRLRALRLLLRRAEGAPVPGRGRRRRGRVVWSRTGSRRPSPASTPELAGPSGNARVVGNHGPAWPELTR